MDSYSVSDTEKQQAPGQVAYPPEASVSLFIRGGQCQPSPRAVVRMG